jgi:hypothetical protein
MHAHTDREASSLRVIAKTLLLLLPLLLATPGKALGYADPGTGAFIYQAAYAAFLGGSFYLRKLLDRFLQRRKLTVSPSLSRLAKRF